jgi:hypothetical protein
VENQEVESHTVGAAIMGSVELVGDIIGTLKAYWAWGKNSSVIFIDDEFQALARWWVRPWTWSVIDDEKDSLLGSSCPSKLDEPASSFQCRYSHFRHAAEWPFGQVMRGADDRDSARVDEAAPKIDFGNEGIPVRRAKECLPIQPMKRLHVIPENSGGWDLREGAIPPFILALEDRGVITTGVVPVRFARTGVTPEEVRSCLILQQTCFEESFRVMSLTVR